MKQPAQARQSDYMHRQSPQIQTTVWQTLAYNCLKLGTVLFLSPASALTQAQGPICSPQGPLGSPGRRVA